MPETQHELLRRMEAAQKQKSVVIVASTIRGLLALIFTIVLAILILPASAVGQYEYQEPPKELWGCFDHAMHYSQDNPEWGMVVISSHPQFRGIGNSHFVNYQIHDGLLYLYDAEINHRYYAIGWQYDSYTFDYYHFYVDGEIPTRYFRYKLPNAEDVYNAL